MNIRRDSENWASDTRHSAKVGAVLMVVLLSVFVAPTTRLFFNPTSVAVVGDRVILHRTFPGDAVGLPRPFVRYVETVQPLTPDHNNSRFCQDALSEPAQYNSPADVGRWRIGDWAAPCLSDPLGYVWTARWYAYLGRVPLGPATMRFIKLREVKE
jgi:hypothetical protein